MIKDIRECAIYYLLDDAADWTTGIYAKSVLNGPNAYEKRNDYQNGWNDAIKYVQKKSMAVHDWYRNLSAGQKLALEDLLLDSESLFIHWDDEINKVHVELNMNDTFGYCADGEELKVEDFEMASKLYKQFGSAGLTAFVAQKRNADPLKKLVNEEYKEAREYLKKLNV